MLRATAILREGDADGESQKTCKQCLTVGFRGKGFGSSDRLCSLVLLLQLFFSKRGRVKFLLNVQDTA